MSRIAIIDMGTNTFHLLLAEIGQSGVRILYRNHEAVRIGMAGINEGIISQSACQRAIMAMKRFKGIMDEHAIRRTYAYGTSALRNARNGPALVEEIRTVTGISVRIISGEEEADLIFAGIQSALHLGDQPNLVMDIGAGSVEFIIGNERDVFWKQSFEIGGQRLLEQFQKHDPITQEEIAAMDDYFRRTLTPLAIALGKWQPVVIVGSSGTFDTLSEIYCAQESLIYPCDASETPLTIEGFYEIYHDLIRKNREERMKVKGMIPLRVEMIVVACCLVRFVLEQHHFESIRVSTYSLKEGALAVIARSSSR